MRIAHFVQRYPPALGGSEAYFARLSRYLVAQGDEVTVFTSTAIDLDAFWSKRGRCLAAGDTDEQGVHVRRFTPGCRFRGRRYLLKALSLVPHRRWQCLTMTCNPICRDMRRVCRSAPPAFDIVHATALPYAWPIVCGQMLAERLRIPFLLTPFLHTGDPDDPHDRTRRVYTRPCLMSLARSAECVFAQTPGERDELIKHGVLPQRIILQGLGVTPDECAGGDRVATRQRWGVGEADIVVGHLANNSAEKGTIDLLQAAQRLWRRGIPLRVMLAGPEMPNFRNFWRTFAAATGQVIRLGTLTDEQKRDFFAGIDIFALPSRSDSFGLVLLEAWASGVPSVVYDAGGPPFVVRHEGDGLVTRCGDIVALADAIERLVRDNDLRARLGSAGRDRLPRDFRWEDKLGLVRATYQRVIAPVSDAASVADEGIDEGGQPAI
ncbi:MAG: glycosyltransferase family 4 protein [Planctomycetes bacterium]|nr:glycosyltransferase family 4 protein [Planctomycetota bacterium]